MLKGQRYKNLANFILLIILGLLPSCNEYKIVRSPSEVTGPSVNISRISALSVSSSTAVYYAEKSPNILILGQLVEGQTINIFSDNACSDLMGSAIVSLQESIQSWMKVSPSSPLAAGDYEFSSSVDGSGECKSVEADYSIENFKEIISIVSSIDAFAAIRADGSVVTWGNSYYGDSSEVQTALDGTIAVTSIVSTENAFAALRADGSVVTWGYSTLGGDSSTVATELNGTIDVATIVSTEYAFAAIRTDGSVVTWGDSGYGGDSSSVTASISSGVVLVIPSKNGFAAVKVDGSIVTWGDSNNLIWRQYDFSSYW